MAGQINDPNAGLGIGVVQPQSGLDYPFVSPGVGFNSEFLTDVRYLFADFYLSYDDQGYYKKSQPIVRNPLRIYWLYGFGTAPEWSFGTQPLSHIPAPPPTHAADLIIVDKNNRVVFDTTTADYFDALRWGAPQIIDDSARDHYTIYEWRKNTKPGETVCRAIKYESRHDGEPLHNRPIQFCPRQAILDERTIEKIPKRILAMRVQNGDCVTPWFKNKITLVNGYNTGLSLVDNGNINSRKTSEILVRAIPGIGRGQYGLCAVAPCEETEPTNVCPPGEDPEIKICYDAAGEKITTINGVEPDANGNILMSADGCLWFRKPVHYEDNIPHNYAKVTTPGFPALSPTGEPITNVMHIGGDCAPCCACDDYVNVAQYLRRTASRYKDVGNRTTEIKNIHEQNILRWLNQSACRQQRPLKLLLVQQPCPCIDVVVGYCNQCDTCAENVILTISFSGAPDADVSVNSAYTQITENGRTGAATLNGGWPVYSINFPIVQARSSVSGRFRICFCPKRPHTINGVLTGISSAGQILGGCTPDAPVAIAEAAQVVDCEEPDADT